MSRICFFASKIVYLINLFFFFVIKNIVNHDLLGLMRKVNSLVGLLASAIVIIAPIVYSWWLYHHHSDKGSPVNIAVVQPNVDPYNEKFNGTGDEQLAKLLRLASTVADSNTDYFVAPETALPDGIWEDHLAEHKQIKTIEKFLKGFPKATMVIGASTYKSYESGDRTSATAHKFRDSENYYDAYNTGLQIDQRDSIMVYHKTRRCMLQRMNYSPRCPSVRRR